MVSPSGFSAGDLGTAVASALESRRSVSADALDFQFLADSAIYDGRFANNGWLQETPDPMTKVVWDNPANMSPNTAKSLKVWQEHAKEDEDDKQDDGDDDKDELVPKK